MQYMQLLPLLLVFGYPLHIRGLNIDLKSDKTIEELLSKVAELTETVRGLGEMVQSQEQNIRDLRKSLDQRLRENDLKIEWALTDGTLAPKNTSSIIMNLERQEKKIDELREFHGIKNPAASCADVHYGDSGIGVWPIYPNHFLSPKVFVSCDWSAGGGWTVIQRRFDGSVDFYRGWEEYAEGFGDPTGEHWLGLRHIHALTKDQPMELYIGLTDFDVGFRYAKYAAFSVSSEEDKFRLNVGQYSGNAGDSLRYQNGQPFSTKDQDNDAHPRQDCSEVWHGAWWYRGCHKSNLNGLYSKVKINNPKYMTWFYLHNAHMSMKTSVMMIRPTNYRP